MNKPTLRTILDAFVGAMANHTYNKLQAQTSSQLGIRRVEKNKATNDDIGNPQTVTIDRVAHALASFPRRLDQPRNGANQSVSTPLNKKDEHDDVSKNEYVVEEI